LLGYQGIVNVEKVNIFNISGVKSLKSIMHFLLFTLLLYILLLSSPGIAKTTADKDLLYDETTSLKIIPLEKHRRGITYEEREISQGGTASLEVFVGDIDEQNAQANDIQENTAKIKLVWSNAGEYPAENLILDSLDTGGDTDLKVQILTIESKIEKAERLKSTLTGKGIDSYITIIPDDFDTTLIARIENSRALPEPDSEKIFVRPERTDKIIGLCMGSFRVVTTGLIWTSIGIHPAIAASIVAAQTTLTLAQSIWLKTFDNLFKKRYLFGRHRGPTVSKKTEYLRRQISDLLQSQIWRILSGPVGAAHSAASILGQMEIFSNSLISGGGGSLFSTTRNRSLKGDASRWVNFDMFLIGSTLALLDLAGFHFAKIADLGFFELNLSTLGMISSFAVGSLSLWWKPQVFQRFGELQEKLMDRAIIKMEKPLKYIKKNIQTCKRIFSSMISLSPDTLF